MHDNSDVAGAANQLEISFGGETIGHGHLMEDRKRFMVYRGSRVRVAETKTIPSSVKRKRAELLDLGRLVLDGKFYRLTEDEEFSSISNAAGVLLGRSANGKMEWRESSELDAEVESTAPKTSKISNLRSGSEELEIEDCALSNEGQSDLSKSVNMDRINEPTELVEIKQGRKVVARGKVQRPGAKGLFAAESVVGLGASVAG